MKDVDYLIKSWYLICNVVVFCDDIIVGFVNIRWFGLIIFEYIWLEVENIGYVSFIVCFFE